MVEIERLIIQKQLVMNQTAILLQWFFSGTFFCSPLGLTSVEGTLGHLFFVFFPLPNLLQLMSEDVWGQYNLAYSSISFTTNANLGVRNECVHAFFCVSSLCQCIDAYLCKYIYIYLCVCVYMSLPSFLTSSHSSPDSLNSAA